MIRKKKRPEENAPKDASPATTGVEGEAATAPESSGSEASEEAEASDGETAVDSLSGEELEALRGEAAKAADYFDQWQRAAAEIQNLQKRTIQQKQMAVRLAVRDLVTGLLPSIDNLERALGSGDQTTDLDGLLQGVRLVHGEILRVLEQQGIQGIDPAGERLDPNQHEAVSRRPEQGVEENTVLEVLEKGYLFQDMVIRPARVVVAQTPPPEADASGPVEDESEG